MTNREDAMREFQREATWEHNLSEVLTFVISRRPRGVLVVWEEEGGRVAAATAPNSIMLAKGLADAIYEMLWVEQAKMDEDEDDDADDADAE